MMPVYALLCRMNRKAAAPATGRQLSHLKLPLIQPEVRPVRAMQKVKSGKLPSYLPKAQTRTGAISHLDTIKIKDEHSEVLPRGHLREDSGKEGRFAAQIGEKMSNIIKKNHMLNHDYFDQETLSFEENIRKQRERLRERREKEAAAKQAKLDSSRPNSRQLRTTLRAQDREQRKQNNSRGRGRPKLEVKSRKDIVNKKKGMSTDSLNNRLERKMKELQQKISQRTGSRTRLATEGEEKCDNLFDSIHNYLVSPHRHSIDQLQRGNSLENLTTKRLNLESKLKDLQERAPTPKQATVSLQRQPGGEWRRVELGTLGRTMDITVRESNFEGEVSHLGRLQQRNEASLQKFVKQQGMMIDLQLQEDGRRRKAELRKQFYQQ